MRRSLPMAAAVLSEQLLGVVDSAMVGSRGPASLAAVGLGSMCSLLGFSVVLGLAPAVQSLASRALARCDEPGARAAARVGITTAVGLGTLWTAAWLAGGSAVVSRLATDAAIIEPAAGYVRIRGVSVVPLAIVGCIQGLWIAQGRTARILMLQGIIQLTNVGLNAVLIHGAAGVPALGVEGAAIASSVSTMVGAGVGAVVERPWRWGGAVLEGHVRRVRARDLVPYAAPVAAAQLLFFAGMVAFYRLASLAGADVLAATHVLITVALVGMLPIGLSVGATGGVAVSGALARGHLGAAVKAGYRCASTAAVTVGLVGLAGAMAAPRWLPIFFDDAELVARCIPWGWGLALVGPLDAAGLVLGHALVAAGRGSRVMVLTLLTQWGVCLPLSYLLGVELRLGLGGLWAPFIGGRLLLAAGQAAQWRRLAGLRGGRLGPVERSGSERTLSGGPVVPRAGTGARGETSSSTEPVRYRCLRVDGTLGGPHVRLYRRAIETGRGCYRRRILTSDWDLLEAWRGGDADAGDELVSRYFHSIHYFFVTKVGTEADDLTQRTLLACVQSVERISTSFRAYLYGVARKILLKHYEARPRPAALGSGAGVGEVPFEGTSPSMNIHHAEDRKLLLQALQYLSVDHQIALQMFYWEELSIPEISVVLECPTGTVKARLSRGRERLRQIIDTIPAPSSLRETTISTLGQWADRLRRQREHS